MRFTWDARKSDRNLRERGFDFEFATQIFDSPTVKRADTRRDYGERRVPWARLRTLRSPWCTPTGLRPSGEVNRRIISARKSDRHESEAYKKATSAK